MSEQCILFKQFFQTVCILTLLIENSALSAKHLNITSRTSPIIITKTRCVQRELSTRVFGKGVVVFTLSKSSKLYDYMISICAIVICFTYVLASARNKSNIQIGFYPWFADKLYQYGICHANVLFICIWFQPCWYLALWPSDALFKVQLAAIKWQS